MLNVTQWDGKVIHDKVGSLMDAFDATKNQRFAHEYKMAKIALTKFLKKDQPAPLAWEQATCADIWADLRGVTNALTKGKNTNKTNFPKTNHSRDTPTERHD